MTAPLPPAQRKVSLRIGSNASEAALPPPLPPEPLDALLARARSLGLPIHHDPQIAGLLCALRLRQDVPAHLYAAAAAVLASVYDAETSID
jgi:flagellar biosynthesis protein